MIDRKGFVWERRQLRKDLAICRKALKEITDENNGLRQEIAGLKNEIYLLKNPQIGSSITSEFLIRRYLDEYMSDSNRNAMSLIMDPTEAVTSITVDLEFRHGISLPGEEIRDAILKILQE